MRAPSDPSCALQERCFVSSFRPRQLKSNVVFQRNVGADRSAIDSEISKFHKERERIARESRNPQTSNESTELEDALEQNRRWGFGQLGPIGCPRPVLPLCPALFLPRWLKRSCFCVGLRFGFVCFQKYYSSSTSDSLRIFREKRERGEADSASTSDEEQNMDGQESGSGTSAKAAPTKRWIIAGTQQAVIFALIA